MKLKTIPLLLLLPAIMLVLGACGGEAAPMPTYTPYPKYTPYPSPTAVPKSAASLLLALELAYWEKTNPLIERAVLEGGTPLADVYLDRYSGLVEGNMADWEQFVAAVDIALPVYEATMAEWLKIQPPSAGRTGELHSSYGLAWSERIAFLSSISVGWRTGDNELIEKGMTRMDTASALGRDAQALRVQFNTYMLEQCDVHRLPECF